MNILVRVFVWICSYFCWVHSFQYNCWVIACVYVSINNFLYCLSRFIPWHQCMKILIVHINWFSSVQLLSHVWLFVTSWTAAHQASLCITNCQSLPKTMSIESMIPSIHPSHPLLSPSPPAFNLSQHQGHFKWVSSLHHVAKVLEFQLQHQSFQWTPRTDLL